MMKKTSSYLITVFLFTVLVFPTAVSFDGTASWWDENWDFRQHITIPSAVYPTDGNAQPIDVRIAFKNKCWTETPEHTSIRVCCHDNGKWYELESQIYNLQFSEDSSFIERCNLVFLLPTTVDGDESYYVYYDDDEKSDPSYSDYVKLYESRFYQEPIPGQKVDVRFYGIEEAGSLVYYVAQEGTLLGQPLSQGVVKLRPGSTNIKMNNSQKIAQFSFSYYYGVADEDMSSTGQELVSKKILVDGNLMVAFKITSKSTRGDLQTTCWYRYYYCPTQEKRIRIHVKHETLNQCTMPEGVRYWDGSYATLTSFHTRSSSIRELNFGTIPSSLLVYTDDEMIKDFSLDKNPEYKESKVFLSAPDSLNLGKKAWISFDDQKTSNAIILSSNKEIVKSGKNERDGVQVRGFEVELVDIPGLEADFAQTHLTRYSYAQDRYDMIIPSNFVAEFNAEFFTASNGTTMVNKEASRFQSLTQLSPFPFGNETDERENDVQTYNLTVRTSFAPSFPLGSLSAVLTGKNLSYITAELYQNETLVSSGIASRAPLKKDVSVNLENMSLFEKIRTGVSFIDWKNASLFKTVDFPGVVPGNYVVKVFRENPLFKQKNREFIGMQTVEVTEDTVINIRCTSPGNILFHLTNQKNEGVESAEIFVSHNGEHIAVNATDDEGYARLTVPTHLFTQYQLTAYYKGFKIFEENIRVGKTRSLFPVRISKEIELNRITVRIKDIFGFIPGVQLTPVLTSADMEKPMRLQATTLDPGVYCFQNLPEGDYTLRVVYKSFIVEEKISVPLGQGAVINLVFPAEFMINVNVFDRVGISLQHVKVTASRNSKTVQNTTMKSGKAILEVPPGNYSVAALNTKKSISVTAEEHVELVTSKEPTLFSFIHVLSLVGLGIAMVLSILRKIPLSLFLKITVVVFLLLAVTMPWWTLHGVSDELSVERTVDTFPWSQKMVSKTVVDDESFFSLSTVPDVFSDFLFAVLALTVLCMLVVVISTSLQAGHFTKSSFISAIVAVCLLVAILALFFIGMNQFCTAGIGDVFGSGTISVNIPAASNGYVDMYASWGMNTGFYLGLASIILLLLSFVINSNKYHLLSKIKK